MRCTPLPANGPPRPLLQASFLHAESLSGDNRYLCDFCGTKVDALRRVRLRALPPYLCLALQRFYFDPRVRQARNARNALRLGARGEATPMLRRVSGVTWVRAARRRLESTGALSLPSQTFPLSVVLHMHRLSTRPRLWTSSPSR